MSQALFIDTGEQSVIHSQGGNKLFSSVLLKCAFYPPVAIPIFLRAHSKNQERWRIFTHLSRQEPLTARKEAKWRNPDYLVFTWFCEGLRFSETKLKFNRKVWTHQMAGECQFRTGEQTQGRGRLARKGEWSWQSPRGGGRQGSPDTEQSAQSICLQRLKDVLRRGACPNRPGREAAAVRGSTGQSTEVRGNQETLVSDAGVSSNNKQGGIIRIFKVIIFL